MPDAYDLEDWLFLRKHIIPRLMKVAKDGDGMILWHGKPYMSASDYQAITDYHKYAKLPWEVEAIHAQKTLPRQWLRSNIPKLKGQDPTLDYLIDNDLLL